MPCILVSGAAGEELVVRAMRSGATDYVLKGSLEALAPAVERALAERAARREQIRLEADLTAAHATVRDSETLLRGSLDAMIDPLLIASSIRDRDGTITGFQVRFANRAAAAFIGRTADSLAGAPIVGGLPFLGETPSFEVSRTVVDSGEAWMADGVGFTVLHADGSRRRGLANVRVTRSGDGFLAAWRDVTEVDRERRERERLGAALEQTSDGVLMVGLDGVVTYANPAFLAGTGLTLDAVVGGDAGPLATEALGSDGLADIMEAVRARVPWHRRVVVTVPGAAIRRVDVDARPVRDAAGEVCSYIATTHDVTDLVEAEAQLERRRALGSAVAGVARQLVLVDNPVDIARLASHAIVATGSFAMAWVGLVDPETSRIVPIGSHGDTGYLDAIDARADTSPRGGGAAGQAVRTRRTVVVNDIAASPLMAPWQAAAERHGYHSVAALPLRYLDTTRGAIVVYGAQTDAFGPEVIEALEVLVSDVARALARLEQAAQQNKLQDALAASERRFRETLANVSLVAMMLDTRGTILFANRYLLALSGWSEAEIVGLDWHDVFVPPEDRITARAGYSRVIDTGKLDHGFRSRLLTREGQIREMEWSSALLRDEAGSIVGLAGLGSDITERAEAQAALEASEVRLQTALDQMLEGVTLASAVRNEEGRIVDFRLEYVNSALARLGRVAAADQVGHTLLELFPAHKSSGLFDEYVQVVETGVPSEVEEFHFVDPDAAGGPLDQWVDIRAAKARRRIRAIGEGRQHPPSRRPGDAAAARRRRAVGRLGDDHGRDRRDRVREPRVRARVRLRIRRGHRPEPSHPEERCAGAGVLCGDVGHPHGRALIHRRYHQSAQGRQPVPRGGRHLAGHRRCRERSPATLQSSGTSRENGRSRPNRYRWQGSGR